MPTTLHSPRVKSSQLANNSIIVHGDRDEKLSVVAVTDNIVRVTHAPDGQLRLDRTWSVVGDHVEIPREGRVRDDYSIAFPSAPCGAAKPAADGAATLETTALKAEVVTKPGEHLRIVFRDAQGRQFAADRPHGAYLHDTQQPGGAVRHYMTAVDGERYFGFGETSGELDKAGRRLRVAATDAMAYSAKTSDPLYKHMPCCVVLTPCADAPGGVLAYGLLYDNMALGVMDVGQEISAFRGKYRYYEAQAGDVDAYVVLGPSVLEVVERLSWLIGRNHPPPRWALGYLGSTMFYTEQPDAQSRLRQFGALCVRHGIPCSAFHLSSGYTTDEARDARCVFTWNRGRVPQPEAMFADFHGRGMRVLPNIKPWLLVCHPAYAALAAAGGLLKTADGGAPLVGRFWSGGAGTSQDGSYVDFASTAGYEWWVAQVAEQLVAFGADGAWNDNNEFEVDDDAAGCGDGDGDGDGGGGLTPLRPLGVVGRALHTLLMARASRDALLSARPEERPFVVTRSGCLGAQRYAQQTWSGDNSTGGRDMWEALRYNIPMGLGLGLCGWAGSGHDVGGFAGPRPPPELFARWVQQGAMQPRFVIHSGISTDGAGAYTCNEPWMYPETVPHVRAAILLRYRLLPLLQSLHLEAFLTGRPVARALACHFAADAAAAAESFLYTLGASLLVATVLAPLDALPPAPSGAGAAAGGGGGGGAAGGGRGGGGRGGGGGGGAADGARAWAVRLPRGEAAVGGQWCNVASGEWHAAGNTAVVAVDLSSVPLFAAGGACVPVELALPPHVDVALTLTAVDVPPDADADADAAAAARGARAEAVPAAPPRGPRGLMVFPPPGFVGAFDATLYDDDGESNAYATAGGYATIRVHVAVGAAAGECVTVSASASGAELPYDELQLLLPRNDPRAFVGGAKARIVRG